MPLSRRKSDFQKAIFDDFEDAEQNAKTLLQVLAGAFFYFKFWTMEDLNLRPLRCQRSALTPELIVRVARLQVLAATFSARNCNVFVRATQVVRSICVRIFSAKPQNLRAGTVFDWSLQVLAATKILKFPLLMFTTLHVEKHFTSSDTVRDIVIGMADGLTVPFALAAGLSGAVASSKIVVTAGLAEVAAGSIAMGLGGYLAARSEAEHYENERKREVREVETVPEIEAAEVQEIFQNYGLNEAQSVLVVDAMRRNPATWIDFMMRFELGLEEPDPKRALQSAFTIAASYIVGGLIPLAPYMLEADVGAALRVSVGVTLVALAIFGAVKGHFTGAARGKSALQTALVGGLAATAAFAIARWIR